ncbi:peptidase S9 [Prolixibacter bellariivorans]|uniref:Peptidase S9 n=1 Tax=Prolixibacter bellariivorans TaxID=314319 RepID=A0A5M4B2P6_9BACT|nr:prolyl oligopeptidase family serine peptidase [Prolixibacter bellariivorans]GET34429.1 peptidase S9 [Prolixibacter bellariivorans]
MKKTAFHASILLIAFAMFACKQKPAEPQRTVKQYSIDQFYKNKSIYGGQFNADESKLLICSNESGIYNLYEINLDNGTKQQITDSRVESIFPVDYVPGTDQIIYSADKGGNEISHLYLLSPDSTVVDLTPGEKEKASFAGWNKDKTAMYYLSNKRDPRFFDLYKMKIGDWKPEMIYQNNDGLEIDGISWDEKYLALTQNITTSETKLFLVGLKNGQRTEISQPDFPGIYAASGFSKDGSSFFYRTDADSEFMYLVKYNLADGSREPVYQTNWDVVFSYNSENEKYRVIGVNEDARNKIIVLDNATGQEVAFPDIPDGNILGVSISDNEDMMRLSVGTSKAPTNIYVYNFETKDLKKLTNSLNPDINPDDLVSAEVVRFNSFDSLKIPAIFYKPVNASADNKVPALIWVHGGPGGQSRTGYFALIQYLVNHDYAILAVNNRGSSGYGKTFYKMDDQNHGDKDLMDCIYGKKYLQRLDFIDPEKIGIIGGSYGGYMTMAAMTFHPDEFKVGVDLFGVTNWLRTLKSIPPYWESFRKALYAEMGDPFTADSVRLYNISPLFHADQIKNPVMVLQGKNDPRVLQVESDEIVNAMKQNNVPVEYVVFPDEGHGFRKKENEITGYGKILTFLDTYLKGSDENSAEVKQ